MPGAWGKLILAGCLIATPATAAFFGEDDRITVSRAPPSEMAPVVLVTNTPGGGASGVLISRCHVLTSAHILTEDVFEVGKPELQDIDILSGQGADGSFAREDKAAVIFIGRFRGLADVEREFADWALLELTPDSSGKCLGDLTGWIPHIEDDLALVGKPEAVKLAGYPADLDRDARYGVWVDPKCTIHEASLEILLHDCSEAPGMSGGPILGLSRGRWHVVGINTGTFERGGRYPAWQRAKSNLAVRVSNLAQLTPILQRRSQAS